MRRTRVLVAATVAVLLMNSWTWADLLESKKAVDDFSSVVASSWFELLYDVVKTERTPPPQASRIYGITAVALYESIVAGTEQSRSLVGQLNGLTVVPQPKKNRKHHWPSVANTVLANTIRGLYSTISPASSNLINNLEQSFASQFQAEVPEGQYERSVSLGEAVASAILGWAATDGLSTKNNCPYVPADVPGAWQPTPPVFNPNPLQPCWGELRPMVLTSGEQCPPVGHPTFSAKTTSHFYAEALEVYNVGLNLTTEQKTIADYWSDGAGATGTPSGHWIAIVSQIARNDGLSLAAAAEAYARVGIAVHDSFICLLESEIRLQPAASRHLHQQQHRCYLDAVYNHAELSDLHLRTFDTVRRGGARPRRHVRYKEFYRHDPHQSWAGTDSTAALVQVI
jgi:hypothetical protein